MTRSTTTSATWIAGTSGSRSRSPAANIKEYGSAVWNHWLAKRYGPSIVRSAWAQSARPRCRSYDAAIRDAGPSDFTLDFSRFARDLAEWRTDTAFPEGTSTRTSSARGPCRPTAPTLPGPRPYDLPAAARPARRREEPQGRGRGPARDRDGARGGRPDRRPDRRDRGLRPGAEAPPRDDEGADRPPGEIRPDHGRPGQRRRRCRTASGSTDWRYTGNDDRVAVRARLIR